MTDNYLDHNGRKIYYRTEGNGSKLLFIHGFGEDGNVWSNQVFYLKDHFQLIIPDLPGSGTSELVPDMSIEGMAEVIRSILERERPAHVVAHSMGGYISLALLEKYPELLNSLCLFHSTAYADTEEKKLARRKGIDFILNNGPFEFLKTSIPNLFSPQSKDGIPGRINEFIAAQHNFTASALVSYYEAMMDRPDRSALLKNSRLPFLFILGKYDNAVPFSDGLAQCHLPEKSYIHILRNSGHMGMLEESEKVNPILKDFLVDSSLKGN